MKPNPKSGFQSVQMKRINNREKGWLNSVYGQPLVLWECNLPLKNNLSNRLNSNNNDKNFEL